MRDRETRSLRCGIDLDHAFVFFRHRSGNIFDNHIDAANVQVDDTGRPFAHQPDAGMDLVRNVTGRTAGRDIQS